MAPTQSKHDGRTIVRNGTRLLKQAIGLKYQKKDEGKYDTKLNVVLYLVMLTLLPTRSSGPIQGTELQMSGYSSRKDLPGS